MARIHKRPDENCGKFRGETVIPRVATEPVLDGIGRWRILKMSTKPLFEIWTLIVFRTTRRRGMLRGRNKPWE